MLNKQIMVDADNALAGRQEAMAVEPIHFVNGSDITAPATQGQQEILLGMGCFWGQNACFGNSMGWFQRRLDTVVALRSIPPTKKCAVVKRAIRKWCA